MDECRNPALIDELEERVGIGRYPNKGREPVDVAALAIALANLARTQAASLWRRFVSSTLQKRPKFQIVCEVSDGLEAVQKAHELQPDLVLLDIGLPKLDGIEAANRIQQTVPSAKILFVTQNYDTDVMRLSACLDVFGTRNNFQQGQPSLRPR